MATQRRKNQDEEERPRQPPAKSPESREAQLVSLAVDLAEKQLASGEASAQVISHYLKIASPREKLERERLRRENELLRARVENLESAARIEELYEQAINAMRSYGGSDPLELESGRDDDY